MVFPLVHILVARVNVSRNPWFVGNLFFKSCWAANICLSVTSLPSPTIFLSCRLTLTNGLISTFRHVFDGWQWEEHFRSFLTQKQFFEHGPWQRHFLRSTFFGFSILDASPGMIVVRGGWPNTTSYGVFFVPPATSVSMLYWILGNQLAQGYSSVRPRVALLLAMCLSIVAFPCSTNPCDWLWRGLPLTNMTSSPPQSLTSSRMTLHKLSAVVTVEDSGKA